MWLLLAAALDAGTVMLGQHMVKMGHGVVARDLGDGQVEVVCEVAPETPSQRLMRLRAELRQAELDVAAEKVNRAIERRRGKP